MNIPLINIIAKQRLEQQMQKEALRKQLLCSRLSGETRLSLVSAAKANVQKRLETSSAE